MIWSRTTRRILLWGSTASGGSSLRLVDVRLCDAGEPGPRRDTWTLTCWIAAPDDGPGRPLLASREDAFTFAQVGGPLEGPPEGGAPERIDWIETEGSE